MINLFKRIAKKQKNNNRIHQRLNLIEALELINRNRIKELSKVRKILGKITKEPVIDFETTILAYLNKFDLLLYETKISDKNLIFEPAEVLIKEIVDFIERRNLISWLAHVYSRYAQLKMLKFEFNEAKIYMLKAEEIATSHNLLRLSYQITNENDKQIRIINQAEKLKNFDEKSSLLSNSINFDNLITGVGQRNELIKLDQPNEEKIFLTIINKTGVNLFSHKFVKFSDDVSYEQLIKDFLSTINSVLQGIFSSKQKSNRMLQNEFTFSLKVVESFLIGYVYKGSSIKAQNRINCLIQLIQTDLKIYNQLTDEVNEANNKSLRKIIVKIFD